MSIPVVAFFNNKGGVGKTSLVYHLAWMCAISDIRVLAADFDPQANLSAAFLEDEKLEELWGNSDESRTVFGFLNPLVRGVGDIESPDCEVIDDNLALVVGDLNLSSFEDQLATEWPRCNDGHERSFRVMSAFWRIMQNAAEKFDAELILMDLGPNLGAINRAALISSDYVVVPLSPDLFSLQGLRNLGPTFRRWRQEWQERLKKGVNFPALDLPKGQMETVGYIVLQHSVRLDRPVKAYQKWISRIPNEYRESVLGVGASKRVSVENDPECLALLRHYRSLMPLAQEARKPMFSLRPADGAIGSHLQAAEDAHRDFLRLAKRIVQKIGVPWSV